MVTWECTVCGAKKYDWDSDPNALTTNTNLLGGSGAGTNLLDDAPAASHAVEKDELTGFMNNGGARDSITSFLKSNKNSNFTICMCDIDGFRNLNETKGKECGDLILKEVASLISKEVSSLGTPYRWGGDEFLILFPGKNGDEVYNTMFTLRDKIKSNVIYYDGDGIGVTVAFGLTEYDFSGNIDAFIDEAKDKLDLAKRMGGDQVIF